MRLRVKSWRHAVVISSLITALAVLVPITVVGIALWQFPLHVKWPALAISGAIPLFITFPIAIFSLSVLKSLDEALEQLDCLVKFDPLTGLMARTPFLSELKRQRGAGGYLVFLDADYFKLINDTHGHLAGDEALRYMASGMTEIVGSHGTVARLGGEEFAVWLPQLTRNQAELLLSALGTKFRNEGFDYRGVSIRPTMSMGVVAVGGERSISELLRAADVCLYRAKTAGRDRFVFEGLDERQRLTA